MVKQRWVAITMSIQVVFLPVVAPPPEWLPGQENTTHGYVGGNAQPIDV